ncbi:MAG: DUF1616 domain-containing protein [Candidatus Ranarchaeia archaeon]
MTWHLTREERLLASAIIFAMVVIGSGLTISLFNIPSPEGASSISILNAEGDASPLPTSVKINESLSVLLKVENHEGSVNYYTILVKQGNFSVSWNETSPSPFPLLQRYVFVLLDGETWSQPVTYIFNKTGMDQRIIWELWELSSTSKELVYTGSWVYLPLNITE